MIYGADTTFLVQLTVSDLTEHAATVRFRDRVLDEGHSLAVAPQALAEFVHIVTDPRRFRRPLGMADALRRSSQWWNSVEVRRIYPNEESVLLFSEWMDKHRLGRKRILDTLLAATFQCNGIQTIITSDRDGFSVFGTFKILDPVKTRRIRENES